MTPDNDTNYVERIKLIFEINKHLTTLASATFVVFISFIATFFLRDGKIVPTTSFTWAYINTVLLLLGASIIVAVINMLFCFRMLGQSTEFSRIRLVLMFGLPAGFFMLGLYLAATTVWALFN
jgi:hypothetical protein